MAARGNCWILKSPQHIEQFPALRATFPDATFVLTHRDPVSVTASLTMMITYSLRLGHDEVDVPWVGRYWSDRLEHMLHSAYATETCLCQPRPSTCASTSSWPTTSPWSNAFDEVARQPMTNAARKAMAAFMDEHPRGRHGDVHYDLAEFGIDVAERRKALAFYVERFGVREER